MLTCKQLTAELGISVSTMYRLLLKGLFPKPIRIGPRGRRWPESAIREWLAELKASDEKEYGSESTDLEANGGTPSARPSIGHLVGGNFQRQVRLGGRGSLDRMIAARIGAELTRMYADPDPLVAVFFASVVSVFGAVIRPPFQGEVALFQKPDLFQ